MEKYEKEFANIIDYALLNKINKIVFQERDSGSKILMAKQGDFYIYNDSYEKGHIRQIFKSIYEKCTTKKFDETELHFIKSNINFNGLTLKYFLVQVYPNGLDVNFTLI